MSKLVPRIINEQEILVRFIFEKHFKNKAIDINRINDGEVFLDTRGVSLQRESYCPESKCKELAKENKSQKYIGFVIFRFQSFTKTLEEYKIFRPDFDAKLVATPLDENLNFINDEVEVTTNTLGLPAHADIKYINPAIIDDETPKIAIRKFSRNLFKKSLLIIDDAPNQEFFLKCVFKKVI